MELICPAGTPAAFREAVNAGADVVYCGFRDETNARNFPGLNFTRKELEQSIAYARSKGTQTYVALNTFMRAGDEIVWYEAVDDAVRLGADAVIIADFGLMAYVAEYYPLQRLHVSVQASASNVDAVNFLVDAFGAKRVVSGRRRRPLKGSPPSAAQTERAVFPHSAFMNGFVRSEEKESMRQG
jgi:collagenase-like PrtC family protease